MVTVSFVIYYCIVLYMTGLTVWNIFREKSLKMQAATALVLIPLVLRVLLLK